MFDAQGSIDALGVPGAHRAQRDAARQARRLRWLQKLRPLSRHRRPLRLTLDCNDRRRRETRNQSFPTRRASSPASWIGPSTPASTSMPTPATAGGSRIRFRPTSRAGASTASSTTRTSSYLRGLLEEAALSSAAASGASQARRLLCRLQRSRRDRQGRSRSDPRRHEGDRRARGRQGARSAPRPTASPGKRPRSALRLPAPSRIRVTPPNASRLFLRAGSGFPIATTTSRRIRRRPRCGPSTRTT